MRVRQRIALGIILVSMVPAAAWTQSLESRRAFGRYQQFIWNDQHGLQQNTVNAARRTRDGYMWLGTVEGAARFDGVRFVVFNRINTPQLRNSSVNALYEDRQGGLWFGTDAGVARLKDGVFTSYTREDGLADDHVHSIIGDPDGTIWIGTYLAGVVRFKDGKFTTFGTAHGLPHEQVWSLAIGPDGKLWVGTLGGVAVFDGGRFTSYTVADGLPDNAVHAIRWDRAGRLWVGTDRGVAWLQNGRVTRPPAIAAATGRVYAVSEGRDGAIWIATRGDGLYRFADDQLASFRARDGLPGDDVLSLYQDPDGDMWVGTNGWGAIQLRQPRLRTITTEDGLAHNSVRSVFQDRSGAMWIGTDKGLSRLANGGMTTYTSSQGIVGGVLAVDQDPEGDIWVGLWRGIGRLRHGRFEMVSGMADVTAAVMLADRAGNFWIGTANRGLFRVRDGHTTILTKADGLPTNQISALGEDRTGALWIGTLGGGVTRLQDGRFTTWSTKDGLNSNRVISFFEDPTGALWIGTHGGGLHRFKHGRFSVITSRAGLYDDLAFSIQHDGTGNLWMVGNRGIYRAVLQSLNDVADGHASRVSSIAYGVADGMINREGNGGYPAAWRSRDGRLWFATMGGAVVIDALTRNERPPLVAIEGVTIDGEDRLPSAAIDLPSDRKNIEVHYTGLSWYRPQEIRFRYRLAGLDPDWVEAGPRRTAYYSHLRPGRYTFQVIADNGDGTWNTEGQRLALTIVPAFYQTGWFVAVVAVAGVGTLTLAWQRRVAQWQRTREAHEAFARQLIASQERERQRLAGELHDSLGQHLLIITNRAALGKGFARDASDRLIEQFDEIHASALQAIGEVRAIAQNLRPINLDRLGLTAAIEEMVEKASGAAGVEFSADVEPVDGLLVPDNQIVVYRILQESITNILKHSGATRGSVEVWTETATLRIRVKDNGRGLAQSALKQRSANGSGLGLVGMAERVRILGGTHAIVSAPGQGTTVSAEIPLEPANANGTRAH